MAQDVDLAITFVEKKARGGIQTRPLLELPLILLVQRKSRLARSEELWRRDKIEETLISFPRTDPVQVHFQRGLEHLGVEWFCGIEVNSARLTPNNRNASSWIDPANKIYRSENVTTLFPSKGNVIAFCFASCLEIDQQDRVTSTMQKSCAINHAQTIGANAWQK